MRRLYAVRKALAGRRGDVTRTERTLLPMRFADLVAAAGVELPGITPIGLAELRSDEARDRVHDLLPFLADLVGLWEAYLRIGGFPQAVAAWRRTGDVTASLVDTLRMSCTGMPSSMLASPRRRPLTLLEWLTANLCSPVVVSDLARDGDAAPATVKERLAGLAENFLVWPPQPHPSGDRLRRPVGSVVSR